ncbi:hypothetical protein HSB1_33100 [Halogranum salarium B-1]|uniref:Uncharacterized protein n=1 Tax=Halogranum salarium B-1 TaxID=1210908 RepID=J2ZXZ0_9EURY|nr:hypothetical protein HSB1_33100 [Halogranum salarium B-1]
MRRERSHGRRAISVPKFVHEHVRAFHSWYLNPGTARRRYRDVTGVDAYELFAHVSLALFRQRAFR